MLFPPTGGEGIAPLIHNPGTRRKWVVAFTVWTTSRRRRKPGTHLTEGCMGRSGRCREEKNPLPLSGIEPLWSSPQSMAHDSPYLYCQRNKKAAATKKKNYSKSVQTLQYEKCCINSYRVLPYMYYSVTGREMLQKYETSDLQFWMEPTVTIFV
jgi:hypothetical protein